MPMLRFLTLCLAITTVSSSVLADAVQLAEKGSNARAVLLDAVRPKFEVVSKGPIEFVVQRLAIKDGWAFGRVTLQRPGGKKIDWRASRIGEEVEAGMFDDGDTYFLLKKGKRQWTLIESIIGPTDVAWEGWVREYHLPRSLFQSTD